MLVSDGGVDPGFWSISLMKEWSLAQWAWHIKWVPAQKSLRTNTYTGRSKTCFSHAACCWDLTLNGIKLCKSSRLKDELREADVCSRRHFRLPLDNVTSPETHSQSYCVVGPARRGRCCYCWRISLQTVLSDRHWPRQPPRLAQPTPTSRHLPSPGRTCQRPASTLVETRLESSLGSQHLTPNQAHTICA